MTNLPISSTQSQPSGNAANALPASIAADSMATDMQPAEPFAFLLARQIGDADLSALTAAQIAIDGNAAGSGAEPSLKDAQDQAAVAANIPGDPANIVASILMQLPPPGNKWQNEGDKQVMSHLALSPFQGAEDQQATPSFAIGPFQKTDGPQATPPFANGALQIAEDTQAMPSLPPGSSQETGHKNPMTGAGDNFSGIDHLPSEAVKRAELPSGLAQPTPNTAQAIASPMMPTATPGISTDNISSADTSSTITTPLGNNGWADEFSQKIRWISNQQNQVAELHLNPPNLGPLDVMLKISDNQATALFASPHGAVRDAVENALPKLREILADNGIMLGNTTISDQSPRDRSMNEFMNQDFGTAAQHEIPGIASEPADATLAAAQTVTARRHNGMVDTFA